MAIYWAACQSGQAALSAGAAAVIADLRYRAACLGNAALLRCAACFAAEVIRADALAAEGAFQRGSTRATHAAAAIRPAGLAGAVRHAGGGLRPGVSLLLAFFLFALRREIRGGQCQAQCGQQTSAALRHAAAGAARAQGAGKLVEQAVIHA